MKSIQTTLLLFLLGIASFGQGHLPKTMTEHEKTIYQDYLNNLESDGKSTQPPAVPPRTPAEFEEAGGIIISWQSYSTELREIVRHARLRVPVYIVSTNPSSVQSFLNQGGVSMDNVTIVQVNSNSVWIRDYGPQSVYLDGTDELAFIDWVYNRPRPADNMIPYNMANYLDIPLYQMINNPNRLIATGGNFMADGHGTGFSSKLILTENNSLTEAQIDNIMYNFQGIERYIKMNKLPYDNISHLDMHMKLLDEETLLVAEFPQGVSDGPYIEDNLNYLLTNHPTCHDREYQVVRIPMVPSSGGNYPPNAHYRTFTNSIIINDLVLVPNYFNSALNQQAMQIYQQAMPGYEIIGIDMENVIGASGAIHCITREIAATDPIFISHATLREIEDYYQNYPVEAIIKNVSGLNSASVFYRTGTNGDFTEITMEHQGNDLYTASIPAQACNATVQYYLSATNANKTITKPFTGASGPWTFELEGEAVNFNASQTVAGVGEDIVFHYLGCLNAEDLTEAVWNFGEGANPETAIGIDDVSVTYNAPGHKTITLSIDGEELVRQNFILITDIQTYQLNISVVGEGETTPAAGTYSYEEGSEITLSAVPAPGWAFDEWQIVADEDMVYEQSEIDVTMNRNINAKAVFSPETSVSEWQNQFLFDVFPNPAQGRFNVVMTPTAGLVNIEVYNITGQRVFHDSVRAEYWDQQFSVDLSSETKGIYFVKVSWEAGSKTRKVILQ